MTNCLMNLSALDRSKKILIQFVVDFSSIVFCFIIAMTIRLESFDFLSNRQVWLPVVIATVAAIGTFWSAGLYRTLVRFLSGQILVSIGSGVLIFALTLFVANSLFVAGIPRSVSIISAVLIFLSVGGVRFIVRHIFQRPMQVSKRPVVIYGAGGAGLELRNSLFHGRDYAPIAFVDDDRNLHGLTISGLPVYSPRAIPKLAEAGSVEVVLLAMPNLSNSRRREIFSLLEGMELEVKTVPGFSDIINGKAQISELRHVTPEDLLGRDAVAPNKKLLERNISGKVVLVSGAGGSIGSELCRQILDQGPKEIILYEFSEFALYSIDQELKERAVRTNAKAAIIPVLGSIQNVKRLEAAIKAFEVETIYHAAAYKHVPLVEENVVEGVRNNVFGTLTIARAAVKYKVNNFILISTDKAVRPANVMGASKHIAELICQAFAKEQVTTIFSMVRFGNVLGSSGSVIPRFRSQINDGGPVTVTHPDINRYFMTIPEAAQLVIQAGAMANGGEVFILDMGEPVRIADLAATMVKLHGFTPYFVDSVDEVSPRKGYIPICFTGLRKGEKLYEELLIGNDPQTTEHPRVMSAKEIAMSSEELFQVLDDLFEACKAFDLLEIRRILCILPLAYSPNDNYFSDSIWEASQKNLEKDRSVLASAGGS